MTRMRILFGAVAMLLLLPAQAQLTLDECQRLARDNYPLLKQYDLIEQATDYSVANIKRGYLPQLSVSGQASYQSDVATLPDVLTGLLTSNGYQYKGMARDQYRIAVDLNQVIWDGGNLKARRDMAGKDGLVQTAQTDVDLYAVRQRVNELFFGLLLLEEKIRLNEDLQTLLQDNCRKLEARLGHGAAMKSDVDMMKAEWLKARRDRTALQSQREAYSRMLALFIHKDVAEIRDLQKPDASWPVSFESRRPELALYAARLSQTEARQKLLQAGLRPRLSLFAQGYYGYPGYDMFADMFGHDWSLNGRIGVRLTWDISKLYTYKDDRRKLDLTRMQTETAQATFLFNNRLQSTREQTAVEQYRKMMDYDEDIIAMRTSVRQAAEKKLEHGVIDANGLLQEITRENQARTECSTHEIEMLKSLFELKHTLNQE